MMQNYPGNTLRSIMMNIGSSALISFVLILPFLMMEVVNRREYIEDFPIVLFFGMWQLLFAITLILLPVVRLLRTGDQGRASTHPGRKYTLLTNPRSAALVSVLIFLAFGLLILLDNLGWAPLQTLINGPNPEQEYLPGLFITVGLFWLLVASPIIARRPILRTLQAGGGLFSHPVNLVIVVLFVSAMAFGLASLIIDQWPCFIGIPLCD